ncbi:MAG: VOC family protein [Opitutales bacterium]
MTPNPVNWFEIYVQDMDRARAFYEAVFETTLEKLPNLELEMWTFPMATDNYGAGGALVKMDGVEPTQGSTMVYFRCEDCAVQEARAAESGGRVMRPKMSIGEYGFISLIYDSEGTLLGLHSEK